MTNVLTLQARVERNIRRRGVTLYNRKQWGSVQRSLYLKRILVKPVDRATADTCVFHITVTHDVDDVKVAMLVLEEIGMDRFQSGVSYNWAISMRTGEVGVGQPLLAKGTHTVNLKAVPGYSYDQNAVARAIAFIGMPGDKLSPKAKESAAHVLAAMMDEKALTRAPDLVPHSLFAAKDCPTDAVRMFMPDIYRRAQAVTKQKSSWWPRFWRR